MADDDSKAAPRPMDSTKKDKVDSYRKGGKVRKTGKARLHKGEVVEPPTKSKRGRKGGRE